jgi:UDP-galactopyranose mutase
VLRSHKPLHDGDILFLAKGNLNKAVVVTGLSENAVASHHFFIIRPKQHVDSRFIAMALNNAAARGYFQSIARGESKKHITKQDLGNFELAKFEKSEESVMIKLMTDADNRFQKMYSQRECFQKAWDLFVQQKSAQALSVLEKIRNFDEQYLSREVEGLVALINATELDPKGKRRQPPKI